MNQLINLWPAYSTFVLPTDQHKSMKQPEKDASKRMYVHRQVTGGITYHFADPIDYGSTPTIRALGGILLRAESGDLPTVLGC